MDVTYLLGTVIFLGLVWVVAFFQFTAVVWTVLLGVALFFLSLWGYLNLPLLILFWGGYGIAASFANLHSFRERYITSPVLKLLRKRLPSISETEREAIEAGHTWWEKELFCGQPQWKKLLQIPKPTLSKEEQDFLNHQVEQLCSMLHDWEILHKERDLPKEVWDYLKKEKFFGLVIPKQYGGLGFSALAHSSIIVKIATRSISAAVNTMVPNSLGPAELLLHYGTEEQKNYYLPRLAKGEEVPCFALTAPEAGSDAGAIPDTGIVCRGEYEGKEVIGIRLNWDKRYITLAPIATVLGLAFRLYDPERLLGEEDRGITLCLIPTSHPGVEIGNRHYPLQLVFMNGPTRGKDVFIPLDWIIGGPRMAGQGWRMLMECLSVGRSISLPALSTGCGKITYRFTGAYAKLRRQFNLPIAHFEGIEEALANIAGCTYLLEASRIMTAGAVDQKIKPAIASAIAKYHMTEMARQVIAHAMDIHAGHTVQIGPRNFLANAHFSIPISITVEGANILTRNLIIFGQGAIRCHPYLFREVQLISAADTQIKELDRVLLSHLGFFISNIMRSFGYGLTGGRWIFAPEMKNKAIKKCYRQLTRMSTALALLADMSLMLLGGNLKRRERISARLGDVLSQLYLASTALKYFHDQKEPQTDVDYVLWSVQTCLHKAQIACDELLDNFPKQWLGTLLHFIIFPFGKAYRKPKDMLCKKIVAPMLESSELRERLTQYCYVSKKQDELTYLLDKALTQAATIEVLWKKLHKAVKSGLISERLDLTQRIEAAQKTNILSADEARLFTEFELMRKEIIKVNEFSFDLATVIS